MEGGITPGTSMEMVPVHRCRCGHRWVARDALQPNQERPSVCPSCKSPRWDKPRKWTRKGTETSD